jgi:hypothetical protein
MHKARRTTAHISLDKLHWHQFSTCTTKYEPRDGNETQAKHWDKLFATSKRQCKEILLTFIISIFHF